MNCQWSAGQLNTPILGEEEESFKLIRPRFRAPQGNQVPVIHLTWQVEGKLSAWISRRKESDFADLRFLFRTFGKVIRDWSGHLNLEWRQEFYEVFKLSAKKEDRKGHAAKFGYLCFTCIFCIPQ